MSNWYAIYTRSRQEKKVKQLLDEKGIVNYLPLTKVLKQWSDRKKWVEVPLFNSYLFVYIEQHHFDLVKYTPGFIRFISFEEKNVIVRDEDIELIKKIAEGYSNIEVSFDVFKTGDAIEIIDGPLKGSSGVFAITKGSNRVLVRIESFHASILLNIPQYQIRKCI